MAGSEASSGKPGLSSDRKSNMGKSRETQAAKLFEKKDTAGRPAEALLKCLEFLRDLWLCSCGNRLGGKVLQRRDLHVQS